MPFRFQHSMSRYLLINVLVEIGPNSHKMQNNPTLSVPKSGLLQQKYEYMSPDTAFDILLSIHF